MFPGFNSPLTEGKYDDLSNILAKVEVSAQSVGTRVFLTTADNLDSLPEELAAVKKSDLFLQDLKKNSALWHYGE